MGKEGKATVIEMSEGNLELVDGRHFSRAGLAGFLNGKHGSKVNGELFNSRDINQYGIRGQLPILYGGYPLTVIKHNKMGVFVEVEFKSE